MASILTRSDSKPKLVLEMQLGSKNIDLRNMLNKKSRLISL